MEVWPRLAQHPLIFAESWSLQIVPHISTHQLYLSVLRVTIALSSCRCWDGSGHAGPPHPTPPHPPHPTLILPHPTPPHPAQVALLRTHRRTSLSPNVILSLLEERGRGAEARGRADPPPGGAEGQGAVLDAEAGAAAEPGQREGGARVGGAV